MTRRPTDNDTDPGPAPATDPGPHLPAVEAPPPIPYEVETANPEINQLLRSLQQPSRAPRPVDVATTDGELAAQYHAPVHGVAAGNETPAPEPSVLLVSTGQIAIETTHVRPPRRRRAVVVLALAACGGALVSIGLVMRTSAGSRAAPSASALASESARPSPPSPPAVAASNASADIASASTPSRPPPALATRPTAKPLPPARPSAVALPARSTEIKQDPL